MSLPRVPNTLGTISKLDDRPNDTGGLTAAELKAKFDKDSETLKKFLNNTLIPYLESASAAAQLGIKTIPGFSAADIQTALEQIVKAMQDVTQGSVTDGSITLAKLAADVTAAALGGAAASHTHGAADVNSGVLDIARIPALTGDKLPDGIVTNGKLGAAAVTSEKLAALAVLAAHIAQGAVTGQKIAGKTITAANIADGTISLDKMANDAKYPQTIGIDTSGVVVLDESWGGKNIYVTQGNNIQFNTTIMRSLPDGWWCRIHVLFTQSIVTWAATQPSAGIYNFAEGVAYGVADGGVVVPPNRYIDITRISWNVIALSGNFTDHNIRSGTADPSGGSNGDIYIKY